MSTRANDDATDGTGPAGAPTIESYETDGGIVLYDAENPLAWVETSRPVPLADRV